MERLSKTLKTAALAGLFGLGVVATTTAARADQVRTYCDRDGDTCTRVVCEDDGDDCKRTTFRNPNRYNRWNFWFGQRNYWNNQNRYDDNRRGENYRHRDCGDDCQENDDEE